MLFLPFAVDAQNLDSIEGDYQALQDFYSAMDGPSWDDTTGWPSMTPETMGEAFGVVVYQSGENEGRVKELNLSGYPEGRDPEGRVLDGAPIGNGLSGTDFPDSFSNLTKMTHIRLKGNNIRAGVMWLEDFAGTQLEWVSLNGSRSYGGQDEIRLEDYTHYNHGSKSWSSYNKFNGFVPRDLSGLTNLRMLELMSTALIGPLPNRLPSSLQGLFMSNSSMSGDIGNTEYSNLTNVTHFYISNRDEGNRGEGTVESVTSEGNNIYTVTFSGGSLPSRTTEGEFWYVYNEKVVQLLEISGGEYRVEHLAGDPPATGDFFQIAEGSQGENSHYGELPDEWDKMSEMRWFYADGNNFSGDIPQWTSWYDLRYFGLGINGSLETPYPDWLFQEGKHTRLHTLNLGALAFHGSGRGVYGELPATQPNSGEHTGLYVFALPGNDMSGKLYQWTVDPTTTQYNVHDNNFSGSFPDLSVTSRLRWVRAENNEFTGSLPDIDPRHDNFQAMRFHNNQFSGDIPDSYGQIESTGGLPFSNLELQNNLLDGNIPEGMFGNGWSIDISNNKFTPEDLVPIMDQDLSGVTYLPQKPFGQPDTVALGSTIDRSAFSYTNNSYQWYKDGSPISGATSPTLDTDGHGTGIYTLQITHPDINYTFESEEVRVVSGGVAPATPSLDTPTDGSTGITLTPTLSWNSVSGSDSYQLQAATSSDFSTIVTDLSGLTATDYNVDTLNYSTTYYWRVRASNSNGYSNWSSSFSFTTLSEPISLSAPDLMSPSNGTTGASVTPNLDWNSVNNADAYQVQVAENSDFSTTIQNNAGLSSTDYVTDSLSYGSTYYWRVRATSSEDSSSWSESWTFTTLSEPSTISLNEPELVSPEDGTTSVNITPQLEWNAVDSANGYWLQVAENSDFSNIVAEEAGLSNTYYETDTLAQNATYHWRVRAISSEDSSGWTATWSFTTESTNDTTNLPAPAIASPNDGADGISLTPELNWEAVEAAETYHLQLSAASDYNNLITNVAGLSSTQYETDSLGYNKTYHFRVRAASSSDTSNWSTSIDFTTQRADTISIAAPTLVAPADGSTDVSVLTTFDWEPVKGADYYVLHVSGRSPSKMVIDTQVVETRFSYAELLKPNRAHDWRVHAVVDSTAGPWSPIWTFETGSKSDYNKQFNGPQGVRMVSSPASSNTLNDLLDPVWTQGVSGADAEDESPTIYTWDEEEQSFTPPSSMSNLMQKGKGYIFWMFEDDDHTSPGIQGGFPKILGVNGNVNDSPVSVPVSITDANNSNPIDGLEGWNSIGNPFNTSLDVDALLSAAREVNPDVNANVYVWDPQREGGADYISLAEGQGHSVEPFQVFWVRYTEGSGGTLTLDKSELSVASTDQHLATVQQLQQIDTAQVHLELQSDNGENDAFIARFDEMGKYGIDLHDAYEMDLLDPMQIIDSSAVHLYSIEGDASAHITRSYLPDSLTGKVDLQLGFHSPQRGELNFTWSDLDDIPRSWSVTLVDKAREQSVDLRANSSYSFEASKGRDSTRFVLSISPGTNTVRPDPSDGPTKINLAQNYPNPFNPSTNIKYTVNREANVNLTVYNFIGKKITTLVDETQSKGQYTVRFNAENLTSGVYVYRLNVGGVVITKSMTLLK